MANDAKIQRISELAVYSKHLGSFMESMGRNFAAWNNTMMQNLEELRKITLSAEQAVQAATKEYKEAFYQYANCQLEDREGRHKLLLALKKAEHGKLAAQRMEAEVKSQYNVARGAVLCILDDTKTFQGKLENHTNKGREFLKQSSAHLEHYKENSKKL